MLVLIYLYVICMYEKMFETLYQCDMTVSQVVVNSIEFVSWIFKNVIYVIISVFDLMYHVSCQWINMYLEILSMQYNYIMDLF